MKVYIVTEHWDYDYTDVLVVFLDYEKALQFKNERESSWTTDLGNPRIGIEPRDIMDA